eukprot:6249513-Ditylum_brightwellii.AAC.1
MNKRYSHNCRTAELHVKRKWLEVITSALWPFCYKAVEERHNRLDLSSNCVSSLEVLLGHKEKIVVEGYHACGYPILVLDSKLQSGQGIESPKWDPRAQAGVYHGHLPVHASN